MSDLQSENDKLREELSKVKRENEVLKERISIIKVARDYLEAKSAILIVENRKLKAAIEQEDKKKIVETPILDKRQSRVHFEDEEIAKPSKKIDEEPEYYCDVGTHYESKWKKNLSIIKSDANCIVLKNNSREVPQCLKDFVFSRAVDGESTVPANPLPDVTIAPLSEYTIYANYTRVQEVFGRSSILYHFPTFGAGKVTEDRILDENGEETAYFLNWAL